MIVTAAGEVWLVVCRERGRGGEIEIEREWVSE